MTHEEQIRREAWHHARYIAACRYRYPSVVTWHVAWVLALAFATGEEWTA